MDVCGFPQRVGAGVAIALRIREGLNQTVLLLNLLRCVWLSMSLTNARVVIFLATLLIGLLLVYEFDGKVNPLWASEPSFDEQERCWH
jgi:hypothetical protein